MTPTLFDSERAAPATYSCPTCAQRVTVHVPLSAPPSCTGAGRHPSRTMNREEPHR